MSSGRDNSYDQVKVNQIYISHDISHDDTEEDTEDDNTGNLHTNKYLRKLIHDVMRRFRYLACSNKLSLLDKEFISQLITKTNELWDDLNGLHALDAAIVLNKIKNFWYDLAVLCFKSAVNDDPRIDLLRRAIVQWPNNYAKWPTIDTLDRLVNAQQKQDFIYNQFRREKDLILKKGKKGWDAKKKKLTNQVLQLKLDAYDEITTQIEKSHPSTTMSQILNKDSLFLKIIMYKNEQTGEVYTVKSVLNKTTWLGWARLRSRDALDKMRDELSEVNPYTVLSVAYSKDVVQELSDDGDDYAKKVRDICARLDDYYEEYRGRGKHTHLAEFQKLCDDIKFFMRRSNNHEENYRLILDRFKEALAIQERNFRKPSLPFLKGKSKKAFYERLDKNDNEYTYPCALRNLLELEEVELFTLPKKTIIDSLTPTPTNPLWPGQRIKKGTVLPLSKNRHERVRLSKSIDVSDGGQYYEVPGKGKKIIADGTHGTIKQALKLQIQKNNAGKTDVIIDPSSWVKKNAPGRNYLAAKKVRDQAEKCIPDVHVSQLFTKEIEKDGVKKTKYWFFMDTGSTTLESILKNETDIKLGKDDILCIFEDLLKQSSFALSNQETITHIKPSTITYTLFPHKKATMLSFGRRQNNMESTLAHVPPDGLKDSNRMVYQIGLVMAELIMGPKYHHAMKNPLNPKLFAACIDSAGENMSIPQKIVKLIKGMVLMPEKFHSLPKLTQFVTEYTAHASRGPVRMKR